MVKLRKLSLSGFDSLDFFSKLQATEKKPAYFTSGVWVVLAWNPEKSLRLKNAKVFRALQKAKKRRITSYHGDLPFIGGAIGFLEYDAENRGGIFHVYDHALLSDGKKLIAVGDRKFAAQVRAICLRPLPSFSPPSLVWKASVTRSEYKRAFRSIQKDIRNGEYYQLNLTYTLQANADCDRRLLFCALARKNPAPCTAYFEDGDTAILSLSPERFLTIDNGHIVTCPIKGTRPRGKKRAEDLRCRNELLRSEKEAAELNMITDLLRNDIGKVSEAGSVHVSGHRLLQKNPSVWHTYSVIEGRLRPDIHPLEALESMIPGGSVTGCPKRAAMLAIDEVEKTERGPYCGCMVMLSDHGRLDSSILIRTIVAKKKHLSLGIGGGIVADSDVKSEWEETRQKAAPFTLLHCYIVTQAKTS